MSLYVDSLIEFVRLVKPYHTKIYGVEVTNIVNDTMEVSFTEELQMHVNLGIPIEYGSNKSREWDAGLWDNGGWDGTSVQYTTKYKRMFDVDGYVHPTEKFDNTFWDYEGWDGTIPSYEFEGSRWGDVAYVTFNESFTLKIDMLDSLPPYEYVVSAAQTWDNAICGINIIGVGINFIEVVGDYAAIFNSQPGFEFEIGCNADLAGNYNTTYAEYDNLNNVTTIHTLQMFEPVPSGLLTYGKIEVGNWDGEKWDDIFFSTTPSKSVASIGTTFGENFLAYHGYGWDDNAQGGWDAIDDADDPSGMHGRWDDADLVLKGSTNIYDVDVVGIVNVDQTLLGNCVCEDIIAEIGFDLEVLAPTDIIDDSPIPFVFDGVIE